MRVFGRPVTWIVIIATVVSVVVGSLVVAKFEPVPDDRERVLTGLQSPRGYGIYRNQHHR